MLQNNNTPIEKVKDGPLTIIVGRPEGEHPAPPDAESLKSTLSESLYTFNQQYFRRVLNYFSVDKRSAGPAEKTNVGGGSTPGGKRLKRK